MSRLGEWLRQRGYPAEFRIEAPATPVRVTVETVPAPPPVVGPPPAPPTDPTGMPDALVAEIATEVWNTRRKIGDSRAARHVRSTWQSLAEAGLEIQDHTDMPFDPGMDLEVLAYQEDPKVTKETILETVKPSVYRGQRSIQRGEVIVAIPEKGKHDGTRDD